MNSTELIPRSTLTEMVNAWNQTKADIEEGFRLFRESEHRLKVAFGEAYSFHVGSDRYHSNDWGEQRMKEVIDRAKRDVWAALVNRMELRRVLSLQRAKDLDHQLETGEGLPEINEPNLLAMVEQQFASVNTYIEESIREVYDWLIPVRHYDTHKTNRHDLVGERVIKTWMVEEKWGGTGYHVNYSYEQNLRMLDNVFHALDGAGTVKTARGPLVDAINACGADGKGETEYFAFKCHKNRTLHVRFKRLDLLNEFNRIAGGMRLASRMGKS